MSSILGLAVRYHVLDFNAMREVRAARATVARATARDTARALTLAERNHVRTVADSHPDALAYDLADLIAWLAGTGGRMGGALAQSWEDIDLGEGTALVRGTNTQGSTRTIHLAEWLHERIRQRAERMGTTGLLFPSPGTADRRKPRDRRNAGRIVRRVLTDASFPLATGHTFRRTVATIAVDAGVSVSQIAKHLGHAYPAMTMAVYLDRKGSAEGMAAVL